MKKKKKTHTNSLRGGGISSSLTGIPGCLRSKHHRERKSDGH